MRFGGMIGIVETIVMSLLLVMSAPIPSLALPLDTRTFKGLPPVEEFIVSHLGIIRVSIRADWRGGVELRSSLAISGSKPLSARPSGRPYSIRCGDQC